MAKHRSSLLAVDLFSGCGGMTEGLRSAGFSVVAAVEIDRSAAQTYALNHPSVRLFTRDIRSISGHEIRKSVALRKGDLDLLAGCPPCQGFSRLRTRNRARAVHDRRNSLVLDFLRIALEVMPKVVLMENVPGLANDGRFKKLVEGLENHGYTTSYSVLDAANFGVPQRRARLILVASRQGQVRLAPKAKVAPTVSDAIRALPRAGRSGDSAHDIRENRDPRIARLISMIPKDGGSRGDLPRRYELACHRRCKGFYDVYGRMSWSDASPTITSGFVNPSKGRFLHPRDNRTLTIREGALLQTFPSDYRFLMAFGKYKVAEMIGNAIPPEFIRRQASAIARHLCRTRT